MAVRVKGRHEDAWWQTMTVLELRPVDVKREPTAERRRLGMLAQIGLGLAVELDRPDCAQRSSVARELRLILEQITGQAGEGVKPADDVDAGQERGWDDPS